MPDPRSETSTADVGDRHRRYIAFSMLAVSVKYASDAAQNLVDPGIATVLDAVGLGMAILAIVLLAPIVTWKIRALPSDEQHLYAGNDGFVADTIRRGHMASWVATFFLLALLASFADRLESLPTSFFLESAIAVMLGVASGAFLLLSRSPEDGELEDLSGA